jgi:ketosteroid isomerase-like protein
VSSANETEIRDLIVRWTRAIAEGNREGVLAHHAKDLLMYDFPSTVHGIDAYGRTWDFFDDSRRGTVTFDPRDISVRADDHLAFATCEIHCDGTTAGPFDLRLTVCLERRGDEWIVTHEHHSVPTADERLIGPEVDRRGGRS